jgi:hypothetical protein
MSETLPKVSRLATQRGNAKLLKTYPDMSSVPKVAMAATRRQPGLFRTIDALASFNEAYSITPGIENRIDADTYRSGGLLYFLAREEQSKLDRKPLQDLIPTIIRQKEVQELVIHGGIDQELEASFLAGMEREITEDDVDGIKSAHPISTGDVALDMTLKYSSSLDNSPFREELGSTIDKMIVAVNNDVKLKVVEFSAAESDFMNTEATPIAEGIFAQTPFSYILGAAETRLIFINTMGM